MPRDPLSKDNMASDLKKRSQPNGKEDVRDSMKPFIPEGELQPKAQKVQKKEEDKNKKSNKSYATIRMEDGKFCVFSKDGSKKFGCFSSREEAVKRLAQIEHFKSKDK